jgi:hypothetical protein
MTASKKESTMTKGFQQQEPMTNFAPPKSALRPQHGQPSEKKDVEVRENRSFKPRPGH